VLVRELGVLVEQTADHHEVATDALGVVLAQGAQGRTRAPVEIAERDVVRDERTGPPLVLRRTRVALAPRSVTFARRTSTGGARPALEVATAPAATTVTPLVAAPIGTTADVAARCASVSTGTRVRRGRAALRAVLRAPTLPRDRPTIARRRTPLLVSTPVALTVGGPPTAVVAGPLGRVATRTIAGHVASARRRTRVALPVRGTPFASSIITGPVSVRRASALITVPVAIGSAAARGARTIPLTVGLPTPAVVPRAVAGRTPVTLAAAIGGA